MTSLRNYASEYGIPISDDKMHSEVAAILSQYFSLSLF